MTFVSGNEFIKFLIENDIPAAVIAALISSNVSNLSNSIVNNILLPIIGYDYNEDGKQNKNNLKNFNIKIGNITLHIGKFLISFIKFIFVLFFVYIASKFIILKNSSNLDLNWEKFSSIKV